MVETFPIVLFVSTILGFLAGIGVGGGSLLMLWLTLVVGLEHGTARFINLLFFLPAALISSVFRIKEGRLPIKKVLPAILSGCMCALITTMFSSSINADVLKKAFGLLLLGTGIREILYKPKDQRLRKAK